MSDVTNMIWKQDANFHSFCGEHPEMELFSIECDEKQDRRVWRAYYMQFFIGDYFPSLVEAMRCCEELAQRVLDGRVVWN